MADQGNSAGFDPPNSDAMDSPAQQPHSSNPTFNGSGGSSASSEGHAGKVPDAKDSMGQGFENNRANQTGGNKAANYGMADSSNSGNNVAQ
jgi:hypothetical protein